MGYGRIGGKSITRVAAQQREQFLAVRSGSAAVRRRDRAVGTGALLVIRRVVRATAAAGGISPHAAAIIADIVGGGIVRAAIDPRQ
jgi:hypothetical protein